MVFNSLIYIFFLCVVSIIYYTLPKKHQWIWLLVASVGYYLSFIPVFLPLIIVITLSNFLIAKRFAKVSFNRKKLFFIFAITVNVLILFFFKYYNFIFPWNQIKLYPVDWFFLTDPINRMILPLGLSYLMFTVFSYHIEVKRETIKPENHLGYFSLYLLFFPKIAQGPIEKPQHLIPQFHQLHTFSYPLVVEGLKLILWGYFKKLVVADRLAIYVNAVYNNSESHNGTTLIIATIFFSFQIYADFSGYTDIALGSANIFGFSLSPNFKRPYFATSIKDFWSRWHMTFSGWLRDYIFLPIAFFLSKKMKKQTYIFISTEKWIYLIATMITFAICGLWHGEGWTYLSWGLLFGIYLTYSQWTLKLNKTIRKQFHINKSSTFYIFCQVVLTFALVSFAWIFFRSDSLTQAFDIIRKILTSVGTPFYESPYDLIYAIFGILLLVIIDFKREFLNNRFSLLNNKYSVIRIGTIVVTVMIILLIGVFDGGQFIYFQF